MIVRDSAGVAVLTLGDDLVSDDGYVVTAYDEGSRVWRRTTVYAARVDGEFDVARALSRSTLTVRITILGDSWSEIRTRKRALIAAVEEPGWVLDVDGSVLWKCEPADSTSPTPGLGLNAAGADIELSIPAQPMYGI